MPFSTLPNITLDKMSSVAKALLSVCKVGDVIALQGDLGTGKTTLSREIIRESCGKDTVVPSPTFTLVQTYTNTSVGCDIWHMDWYRLEQADQVWELGIEEAFDNGVCLIEWAERADCYLPDRTLHISFTDCGDSRTMSFSGNSDWQDRLQNKLKVFRV